MKNYHAIVTVGHSFDKDGNPLVKEVVRSNIAEAKLVAAKWFGGFSLSKVKGGWVDANGKFITDNAYRFEIFCQEEDDANLRLFASFLRNQFNQSAVLLAVNEIETFEFV